MDEELKRYLDDMQARLMQQINDGNELIINRLSSLEKDFANTKYFLVGDALVASRRWLDLEARVSKLERRE
jgi:hypothetical protein